MNIGSKSYCRYLSAFLDLYCRQHYEFEQLQLILALEREITKENFKSTCELIFSIILGVEFSSFLVKVCMTNHKAFDKPPFNNTIHIKRGLHIARIVLAHYAHMFRTGHLSENLIGSGPFENEGYQIINQFTDKQSELFNAGKTQAEQFPILANLNGSNMITNEFSALDTICQQIIKPIVRDAIGTNIDKYFYPFVQRLHNVPNNNDVQKDPHSDTFFPAVKFWFFFEPVLDGRFMYSPYSCSLNCINLLEFHYRSSLYGPITESPYSVPHPRVEKVEPYEGSFRLNDPRVKHLVNENLSEPWYYDQPDDYPIDGPFLIMPQPITIDKPNTLVIANMFGIHARENPIKEHIRTGIHGSIRIENPFITN